MRQIISSLTFDLPSRAKTLSALETLALGTAGGLIFLVAHLPGGLISGAMIATGIAAIAGRPLSMPPILTQTILLLLGISIGAVVSRELINHVSAYPLTIGLLALATFCATFGSSLYLQRVHGWDRTSALLAGSPGALSQITILAVERGADLPAIAVVQTLRVIILTAALPLVLALLVASLVAAMLMQLIKFPASWLFGAMVASGILHGTDLVEGGLPEWMRGIALIGIGALIGSRFARMRVKTLLSHVKAALGSFAIAVAISAAFVTVIVLVTHVRFSDTIVAFAPGAMDAMMALALTLHIDPIFVGAHHLSRFVFVTIATPGIIHLFGRPQEDVDD